MTGVCAVKLWIARLDDTLGHPVLDNDTPFAFEPLFIADEELRPIVVAVIKATYRFDLDGNVGLAEEQFPVNLSGEPWTDAPASSYKYEPETALPKPATDIVLIGHAQPPRTGLTETTVGIKVGPVQKLAKVFGDRYWLWNREGVVKSRTALLEPTPLKWENAFGGCDRKASTPDRAHLETRNPVGTGFGTPLAKDGDHLKLPNIEDPNHLIEEYGTVVEPWGFGFTSPDWQPRASFAGTFDEAWSKHRKPLLPIDFDRRFFNAAAPGLVAPGYLHGDEEVVVVNTTSIPRLAFSLPGVAPPICRLALRGKPDLELCTNLDTIIVNTDDHLLILVWRASAPTGSGPHDVNGMAVIERD